MVLKRTDWRLGYSSTAATVWHWPTVEEAVAVLVAANVLSVRWWWLEERQLAAGVSAGVNGCAVSTCW